MLFELCRDVYYWLSWSYMHLLNLF